ncbi:hypothetical protein [Sphaerisporangium aureirubrum]|uniref:SdpI family protein n=1 Tax=Sphaerisporangium aureirubrum TaxID=1544736 RepID=A0ABW1NSZ2_9ACTN
MTPLSWLLAAVAVLLAGKRRSRYDGVSPVIWWREQRMHRRPAHILGRLMKVVAAVFALVGAFTIGALLIGVLVAAALLSALLFVAWWKLRAAARACVPHTYPVERLDIQSPFDDEPARPPRRGPVSLRPLPGLRPGRHDDTAEMEV